MLYAREQDLYNNPITSGLLHDIKTELKEYDKQELIEFMLNLYKNNRVVKREIMLELGFELGEEYGEDED